MRQPVLARCCSGATAWRPTGASSRPPPPAGIESRLRLVSPALPPDTLGPDGTALFERLWTATGHRPDPYAVNACEAMDAILDAVEHVSGSKAHARAAAVRAFFAIRHRQSPLGVYSISKSGGATLARYADYYVRGGGLESPFCAGC